MLRTIGYTLAIAFLVPVTFAARVVEPPARVIVFPFTAVGDAGSYGWVGRGIQQSLLIEVGRPDSSAVTILSKNTNAPTDPLVDAKQASATVAVYGSYQILDDQIRCTGQVVETETGRVIGALSATGPIKDLFKLEDKLNDQLHSALPQSPEPQVDTQPVVINPPVPSVTTVYVTPQPQPYYPAYSYPYYYGGYPAVYGYVPFYTSFSFRFGHGSHFVHGPFNHFGGGHFTSGHFSGGHPVGGVGHGVGMGGRFR